jgi:hypothetical protein
MIAQKFGRTYPEARSRPTRSAAHRRSRRARAEVTRRCWRRRPPSGRGRCDAPRRAPMSWTSRRCRAARGHSAGRGARPAGHRTEYTRSAWWYRRSHSTRRIRPVASRAIRLSGIAGTDVLPREVMLWLLQALSAFAGPRATARRRGIPAAGARRRCSDACAATYAGRASSSPDCGGCESRSTRGWIFTIAMRASIRWRLGGWLPASPRRVRRHDRPRLAESLDASLQKTTESTRGRAATSRRSERRVAFAITPAAERIAVGSART